MAHANRVAHVMGRMMGGGVEATVMNHYRNIDRDRFQFDFIVDENSLVVPREEISDLGGSVHVIPKYTKVLSYQRALERKLRELHPPIAHSHLNALSVFPMWAAKRAGVPIRIAHSHSAPTAKEYLKTVAEGVLRPLSRRFPTHLAACSSDAGTWLFGDQKHSRRPVFILKNAIDLDKFRFDAACRERLRQELHANDEQIIVGQVGRLCYQKNQLFTLEVFARLLRDYPDALLVIVGVGDQLEEIQAKIDSLSLESSVRMLGSRSDVASLYSAFDVLSFPSRYEGLPLVAIEAQATGLPFVAAEGVPHEAGMVPDLNVFRQLSDGPAPWAESLESLAEKSRTTRSSQGSALASNGYDIRESATALGQWYDELLGSLTDQAR